jgi:hypothetical protein
MQKFHRKKMDDSKILDTKDKTNTIINDGSTKRKKVVRAFLIFLASAIFFCRLQVNILNQVKNQNKTLLKSSSFKRSSIFRNIDDDNNSKVRGSNNLNISPLFENKKLNLGQVYDKNGKKKDVVSSLEARTIRTFYHDIGNKEQREQVEVWKKAWSDSGWRVKVLGLEDAQKHPLFNVLKERIAKFSICANTEFQRLCFIRWLAMAVDGGGWMSDYDILPLDFNPPLQSYDNSYYLPPESEQGQEELESDEIIIGLPNGGKFTAHSLQLAPLTSASQEQITKMLILMINTVEEHSILKTRGRECDDTGEWQITDQEALLIIQSEIMKGELAPDALFFTRPKMDPGLTIHADDMIQKLSNDENDCSAEYKAVHFSGRHKQLKRNLRVNYMKDFYRTWKEECSNERIHDSPEKTEAIEAARKKAEALRVINAQFRLELDIRWQKNSIKNENYNFAWKRAYAKHNVDLTNNQKLNLSQNLSGENIIVNKQNDNIVSISAENANNFNPDGNGNPINNVSTQNHGQNPNPNTVNLQNIATNNNNEDIIVINGLNNDNKNINSHNNDNFVGVQLDKNPLNQNRNNMINGNQNNNFIKNNQRNDILSSNGNIDANNNNLNNNMNGGENVNL